MTPLAIGITILVAALAAAAILWLGLGLLRLAAALIALAVLYPASYAGLRAAGVLAVRHAPSGLRTRVAAAGPERLARALAALYAPCAEAEGRLRRDAP